MAAEQRDKWNKLDIAVRALGALLLPIIILVVSQWYTTQQKNADNARLAQQKAADDAQHDADRVALLLNHLASENARERILALKFIEYLAQAHQFPNELLPALISVVNDKDEEVANAASQTLTNVVATNPNFAKSVEDAAQTSPQTKGTVEKAAKLSPGLERVINVNRMRAIRQ